MKKQAGLLVFFTCAALFLLRDPAIPASAQQPKPTPSDDEVNVIASQLYCPVCQNIPLDVCPTTACHQWRELIRQMLADGKSAAEIKQYFVTNYGASVLSEPPRSGLNWLIYIVPPVAFLGGLILLLLAFRNWKKTAAGSAAALYPGDSSQAVPGSGSPAEDPYIARLEDELKKRR